MIWNKEKEILLCESEDELKEMDQYMSTASIIALDTETNGVHRFRDAIGVSFAFNEEQAFYVPLKIFNNEYNSLVEVAFNQETYLKKWLSRKDVKWILHNAVFDIITLANSFQVDIRDQVFCDTMLLAHTVYNEEGPFGLKPLAAKLIDPSANDPQLDVKENIKAKGGSVSKGNFEMWKCDWEILGKYACYDVLYTFGLYNRLYPEIKKQQLETLWYKEVAPLVPVMVELNETGVPIDKEYFLNLKTEIEQNIVSIEEQIYSQLGDRLHSYEIQRVLKEVKVTSRSVIGKLLVKEGFAKVDGLLDDGLDYLTLDEDAINNFIYNYYCEKNNISRVFNLDSNDDKAFLLYDFLKLPVTKTTKSGKRATDADTLESLCNTYKDKSPIVGMLLKRAAERKLLSTYVIPILENEVNGILYTGFNQTGTISGRLSSSGTINLQTLPRDDKRIKKGFIPGKGNVLIGDDYSSLEPRAFAHVSGEPGIQKIFRDNLDFYSQIAIDVFKMEGVSAKEEDENFLKKKAPEERQKIKTIALAIPYGAGPGRIGQLLDIPYTDAKELEQTYLGAYPKLKSWMLRSEQDMIFKGYVTNLLGRKRRASIVHALYKQFGIRSFDKRTVSSVVERLGEFQGYTDGVDLYLACRNNLNNAKNFQIQSLAASICNAAMLEFYTTCKKQKLKAKLLAQVHDEIIVQCPKEEAKQVANLLKHCMEKNWVANKVVVPMIAEPVITEKSLAEAK